MALRPEDRKEIIEIVAIALSTAGVTSPPLQDVMNGSDKVTNGAMMAGQPKATAKVRTSGATEEEANIAHDLAFEVYDTVMTKKSFNRPQQLEFITDLRDRMMQHWSNEIQSFHNGIEINSGAIEQCHTFIKSLYA